MTAHDPTLAQALERLVDPVTRCRSDGAVAVDLQQRGALGDGTGGGQSSGQRADGEPAVARVGYSLQANRKTLEGNQHADRDAQFKQINRRVRAF